MAYGKNYQKSAHCGGTLIFAICLRTFSDSILTGNGPGIIPGTGSNSCVGAYNGFVRFTNFSVNPPSIWFRPPAGTSQGTISDSSGIIDPSYVPVVEAVRRRDLFRWCGTNTVSFPASDKRPISNVSLHQKTSHRRQRTVSSSP
jgi:hypothetical protein